MKAFLDLITRPLGFLKQQGPLSQAQWFENAGIRLDLQFVLLLIEETLNTSNLQINRSNKSIRINLMLT